MVAENRKLAVFPDDSTALIWVRTVTHDVPETDEFIDSLVFKGL